MYYTMTSFNMYNKDNDYMSKKIYRKVLTSVWFRNTNKCKEKSIFFRYIVKKINLLFCPDFEQFFILYWHLQTVLEYNLFSYNIVITNYSCRVKFN